MEFSRVLQNHQPLCFLTQLFFCLSHVTPQAAITPVSAPRRNLSGSVVELTGTVLYMPLYIYITKATSTQEDIGPRITRGLQDISPFHVLQRGNFEEHR